MRGAVRVAVHLHAGSGRKERLGHPRVHDRRIPLALPYAFVDGLTALGYPHYAIIVSLTRKVAVYLGCTFLFPALWGVQAAFYAEPAADIAGAILAVIVFAVAFPRILKKRETAGSLFREPPQKTIQP